MHTDHLGRTRGRSDRGRKSDPGRSPMSEPRSPWPRFRPGLSAWGPSPQPWFPVRPSRGSGVSLPEPRSRLPGFRAQKVGIPGAGTRKFGSPRPRTPTRSLRVSGSTRTIPLGPSGPGRAALPLDMTVSWAGAAGAASRSRSTSGSRMAARSSERSAGDGCLDPFARYRFLTGRRGAVRAPSRIRTRHAHAVPDPARQMMAQT